MAINNFICRDCQKRFVCKWVDHIAKFDEEKKNPVGVTITVNQCEEFNEVELD